MNLHETSESATSGKHRVRAQSVFFAGPAVLVVARLLLQPRRADWDRTLTEVAAPSPRTPDGCWRSWDAG
jgi:hypothetical protein